MIAQITSEYARQRPTRLWPRLTAYALFEGRPLTTRGRWINPLVLALSATLRRLPRLKDVKQPIYILGTGRSGTTALGLVLSMHHQVGFLNEPKAIWARVHRNEDLIGSYNQASARYRLGSDDVSKQVKNAAGRLYGAYLRISGTSRIVDKYPEMIFRTQFLKTIFPDARFLFLSRNGMETAGSIAMWSQQHGKTDEISRTDWWGDNDRKWTTLVDQLVPEHVDLAPRIEEIRRLTGPARAAIEWIVTMREGFQLMQQYPNELLHIPYESLCAEPSSWAVRLEEFLNLAPDNKFESFAAQTLRAPGRDLTLDMPPWLMHIMSEVESRRAEQN